MKAITKRIATVGLVTAYAVTLISGARMFTINAAAADQPSNSERMYFYNTLTDENGNEYTLAKKFYAAIDKMNREGDFKDGVVEYKLDGIVTSDQLKGFVEGTDLTVPKAFGAARDAYLTDHPELFYIDFYKMTISVGGSKGNYYGYIDSGREANLYHDGGFTSETAVNEAIAEYNERVDEIAQAAEAEAERDLYGTEKDVVKARYVNRTLASEIQYDYGALNDYLENGTASAASVNTAYGGLVNKVAVCGGYSRAFKAVMDKLGIPCLVVNGYGLSQDEKGNVTQKTVMHAWNYVYLPDPADEEAENAAVSLAANEDEGGGKWYAVDVTWNTTGNRGDATEGGVTDKYMNVGSLAFCVDHITDGIISSSNYELKYPALSPYNYGCRTNSNGLMYSVEYRSTGKQDDNGNDYVQQWETISYNGKSAYKLLDEDDLYIAVRYATFKEDGSLFWTVWTAIAPFYRSGYVDATDLDNGYESMFPGNASNIYSQFAVMKSAPDINYNPDFKGPDGQPIKPPEGTPNLYYDYTNEPGDHMAAVSEVFENKSYGTYAAAPHVQSANAAYTEVNTINDNMKAPDSALMDEKYAKLYEITYNEPLHILDESKPIGIFFTAKHANINLYAKLLPLESGKLIELVGDRTIRFKFMPSLMYEHNGEHYTFTFTNVGSAKIRQRPKRDENHQIMHDENGNVITEDYTTDKLPNTVSFTFARLYNACPKYFGYDGRLYVNCCAQPTLVNNSDLSAMDFKDENGNSTFSEQERSQMMLVVNSVSESAEKNMIDEIHAEQNIDIQKKDIIKSETYDIRLQICNKYPTIPDGSYVKIALGFPEGYGPENEGVTFKLFHRKHVGGDEYIVEEIPCVVTQFGIVATVTSFSPYMVAVVPAEKASETKTVYASIEGKGGKLTLEDGKIRTLKQGETYTYTIAPDAGYSVYNVKLNGVDVTDRVKDGKLTVTYDELNGNNEVEIKYISDAAAQRFEENGIVEPVKVVIPVESNGGPVIETPSGNGNAMAVVAIVVPVAVFAIAAVTVTLIFTRNKKKNGKQS
jgi:hypothetical protein